jgi:hypothetical protein
MAAENSNQLVDLLKTIAPYITGGLAGAIFTLMSRIWTDKRNQKTIKFSMRKQKFSTPKNITNQFINPDELSISYKHKNYSYLALYSVRIENTGVGAIENQKVIFTFPRKTDILEAECTFNVPLATCQVHDEASKETTIKDYSFNRIEKGDIINIDFFVDCESLDDIQFLPRGADNVKYITGLRDENEGELEQSIKQVLLLLVLYILIDGFFSIFIGGLLSVLTRALTVTALIPDILRIANLIFPRETYKGVGSPVSVTINNEGNDSIIAWDLKDANLKTIGTSAGRSLLDPINNSQE